MVADFNATPDEMVEYLATEIIQLRLDCSQFSLRQAEKSKDAQYQRRYAEANKHNGRSEAYETVAARLDKIIRDYSLKERRNV